MRGFQFRSSLKKTDPRLRPTKLLISRDKKTSDTQATARVNPNKSLANGQKSKNKPKNKGQACNVSCPTLDILPSARAKTPKTIFCTRNKAILTLENKIMLLL